MQSKAPNSAWVQDALPSNLEKLAYAKMQAGEVKGALVDNEQALQIRRELAAKSPTDAAIQRALALDLLWLGDIRLKAGDTSGAQPVYQEGLDLMREGAGEPGQRDVSDALQRLAGAKEQAADWSGAGAAYQENLEIWRDIASKHKDDASIQHDLINALVNAALAAIEAGQDAQGLALSDEAIGIAPKELWPHNTRADALMLLGRTDEARQIYLAHCGEHSQSGESWEDSVKFDFATFRKIGLANSSMAEIEADFALPPKAAAGGN